jgi:outer membrane protein assembly factor BamB
VLIVLAAWWVWQSIGSGYQTFYHLIAAIIAALAISGWFVLFAPFSRRLRWALPALVWLLTGLAWLLFKPVYNGDMGIVSFRLRFGRDADELLEDVAAQARADDWQTTPRDYPRFLGKGPWAEVAGVQLATDWEANPPRQVWRREIGAGWSAFAIVGPYAVTQEQRGEEELVTCYRVADGSPVWVHADPVRFDPGAAGGLGGPGPRATPTIVGDRIITQGATGLVNCLDARTGEEIWSRDTIAESGAALPIWGKSGSPLIVNNLVVISVGVSAEEKAAAGGQKVKKRKTSLCAYDLKSGKQRWCAGTHRPSYASPVAAMFGGEQQIVCVNEGYVTAHRAKNGEVLWEIPWPSEHDTSASCSQPVPLAGDRLFLSKGYSWGSSLFQVKRGEAGVWNALSLWDRPIKPVMKTKFSNVVIRDGFVYGLDDVLMSCIELETGRVQWKKRRSRGFGHGQVLLVGHAIVVLSESGELALVEASPKKYRELASIQALDPGHVTWNNPAFSAPFLLVRNAREAACYRLPLVEEPAGK